MNIKLTDAQLVMMSAAAQRKDRCLSAPAKIKGAALSKVGVKLAKLGLAREIEAKPGAPIWRRDDAGQGYALKLTAAGLKAIAVEEGPPEATEPGDAPQPQTKNRAIPDQESHTNAVGAVLAALTEADSNVIHWPPDEEFERDWLRRQFYNSLRPDRVVMLLHAIEEHYQWENVKGEPIIHFDYSKPQVEHIMPQEWREHWP